MLKMQECDCDYNDLDPITFEEIGANGKKILQLGKKCYNDEGPLEGIRFHLRTRGRDPYDPTVVRTENDLKKCSKYTFAEKCYDKISCRTAYIRNAGRNAASFVLRNKLAIGAVAAMIAVYYGLLKGFEDIMANAAIYELENPDKFGYSAEKNLDQALVTWAVFGAAYGLEGHEARLAAAAREILIARGELANQRKRMRTYKKPRRSRSRRSRKKKI